MMQFFPLLRGDGTKIAPTGDMLDKLSCENCSIKNKLAAHVGDHEILSPGGSVLETPPKQNRQIPPAPESLNDSGYLIKTLAHPPRAP